MQKQNKLANKFIDTTDKYLKTAKGDDHLKFVRDQWVDYQKMTAALDGDKDAAEAMAKKGNLLSGEKALVAMADFGVANQVAMVNSAYMTKNTGVDASLANVLSEEVLYDVITKIRSAAEVFSNTQGANAMNSQEGAAKFYHQVGDALNNIASANIASNNNAQTLASKNNAQTLASKNNAQTLASNNNSQVLALNKGGGPVVFNGFEQMANMMSNNAVTETFQNVLNNAGKRGRNTYGNNTGAEQLANNTQHTQLSNEASSTFLCNQASQMISQIAAAGNAQLNNHPFVDK